MIIPCECGAKLRVDDSKIGDQGVRVRCPRCGNVLSARKPGQTPARTAAPQAAPSSAPLVLVAHDSEVVRDTITSVVLDAGFNAETAADGVEALRKALELRPQALVLDVGLPGIYGFELCERLKGSEVTKGIKIILLSSVYDMRRYKRTPVSLYGADDYIEKHHIPDYLGAKLQKLMYPEKYAAVPSTPPGHAHNELPELTKPPAREFQPSLLVSDPPREERGVSAPPVPAQQKEGRGSDGVAVLPDSFSLDASIFQKEEFDIPRVDEEDPEAVEKARRFARIIVSDIALYNQEAVAEGLQKGTFYELLKTDVDEGRELYENRVPQVIRAKKDFYQEAFDNFIKTQKQNVR